MSCLTNVEWWKAAGVRAIKTVAQTALATIGTGTIVTEVNWLVVGGTSLLAGFLSLLTSIAGLPELCSEEPHDEMADKE